MYGRYAWLVMMLGPGVRLTDNRYRRYFLKHPRNDSLFHQVGVQVYSESR